MRKILNNEMLFKIYIILTKSFLIYTTIVLYYRYKGLSFTEIMLLNSISAIVTILIEVPSGILADKTKRKNLLSFSGILTLAALIIILFSNCYMVIVFAAILMGISEALSSGADTAFIYDHFKNNMKEQEYGKYITKVYRDSFIATAIAAFLSGTLFAIDKNLPIIITIVLSLISLLVTMLLEEDSMESENLKLKVLVKKEIDNFSDTLKNKGLLKIIFIYVVMTLIISNINYLAQAYLVENSISLAYFGVIFLIFNIASGIGSNYSKAKKVRMKNIIIIYGLILIGLYFSSGWSGIVLMIVARIINGSIWPAMDVEINKLIDSAKRATILSYKSLMIQLSFIVVDPVFGIITDVTNVHMVYLIMALTISLSLGLFVMINRKRVAENL